VIIDPIPSFAAGETIRIGGTTTLLPGEELIISVVPGVFLPGGTWQSQAGKDSGAICGSTHVLYGNSEKNLWIFYLNSTGFEQADYIINLTTPAQERVGSGFFTLKYSPTYNASIQTIPVTPPPTPKLSPVYVLLTILAIVISIGITSYFRKRIGCVTRSAKISPAAK